MRCHFMPFQRRPGFQLRWEVIDWRVVRAQAIVRPTPSPPMGDLPTGREGAQPGGQASAEQCGAPTASLRHARASAATRASCFWVYAYPAFLMYAAHSLGLYWARISPQASETVS